MNNEVHTLVNLLDNGGSSSETDLRTAFPTLYETLIANGILHPASPTYLVPCKDCELDHLTEAFEIKGKYFAKCENNEFASIQEVQPVELNRYELSLGEFAKWLSTQLNLSDVVKIINSDFLYLGKTSETEPFFKVYLACTTDIQAISKKLTTEPMVILWLGETPHNESVDQRIFSLLDLLSIANKDLSLDTKQFGSLTGLLTKDVEELVLRDDVAIRREDSKHFLLLGRDKSLNNFIHQEPIYPMQYLLLTFANGNKVRNKGFTLEDAVKSQISPNKRTISTRIKELNNKCMANKITPILTKVDKTHWKLNSQ